VRLLEERGPLLDHLVEEPGPTWRAAVPAKRWVAFGKALEPLLAGAVLGRLEAWKAVEVGMRLLCRARRREAEQVPPSEGFNPLDRELNRRLLMVKEGGGWDALAREYLEEADAQRRRKELGESDAVGGVGRCSEGRNADRACRLAQLGEESRAVAAVAGAKVLEPRAEWGARLGFSERWSRKCCHRRFVTSSRGSG